MTNTFITYQDAALAYEVQGVGNNVVLLFHGFGQDCSIFRDVPAEQLSVYTIYAFDIFFHGQSRWGKGDLPIEKELWKLLLGKFLTQEKIERFTVGGFSIGSRFVLATFEMYPERVERIMLMAPDAVANDFWFRAATSNPLSRSVFKSMIVSHYPFLKPLRALQRLGFISSSLQKFAAAQMDTQQKRAQVYYTWTVLRKFCFNKRILSRQLNDHQTPVHFFVGRFDKVITVAAIETFLKRLKYADIAIMETGHTGVVKACLPVMLRAGKIE
ncbi:MAG: alpha/beta hydrolase [Chryseolinea sp.]